MLEKISLALSTEHTNLLIQLIELWETFLMQLDAEEGGDPFYKPAPQPPVGETSKSAEPVPKPAPSEENDAGAAAIATIEQEA